MLFVLLAFGFLGGVLAATSRDSDLYMDNVLSGYANPDIRTNRLDPASLSNFNNAFQDKLVGVKVNVQANYTGGTLRALSTLRRAKSCSAPYYSFGNATLNCTLTFSQLEIRFDGKMKYGKIPTVSVKASSNVTGTDIFLEVTTTRVRNFPAVRNYKVRSLGKLNTKFTGLGPLSSFLKMLTQEFNNYSIGHLMTILNNQLAGVLRSSVSRATMPLP